VSRRQLIINADDFGRSHGVNQGISVAHNRGVVTSASLMVRWPAAEEAAVLAQSMPELSVGLHVDLSEWIYRDGDWVQVYTLVGDDSSEIALESRQQLAVFRSLVGRDPSHLDSHQHVHREEPVRSVLVDLAAELNVPLRHFAPGIEYRGEFHGQTRTGEPLPTALTVEALAAVLRCLALGTSEVVCHPALEVDFESVYGAERVVELAVLCSAELRSVLDVENIRLISFDQL
jgi:predicted glycoside hydrolase/deacetylase ChbG (UPF0249 family)